MPYRLNEDVSFCAFDEGLVFLDIERDQYFRLPHRLEAAFAAYVHGETCSEADLAPLVERRILIPTGAAGSRDRAPTLPRPTRSILEMQASHGKGSIGLLLEVLATVAHAQWQLRRHSLKKVLSATLRYRQCRVRPVEETAANLPHQALKDAANAFSRVRLYVPIEPVCLLDSLAVTRFLARRRLPSNIVFGITADPFSAHCWVQAGDLVLNDTVGHATGYMPIRTF